MLTATATKSYETNEEESKIVGEKSWHLKETASGIQ